MRTSLSFILLCFLLCLVPTGMVLAKEQVVSVQTIQVEDVQNFSNYLGKLHPIKETTLRNRKEGYAQKFSVKQGSTVRKGSLILQTDASAALIERDRAYERLHQALIDISRQEQSFKRIAANIKKIRTDVEYLRVQRDREQQLLKKDFSTELLVETRNRDYEKRLVDLELQMLELNGVDLTQAPAKIFGISERIAKHLAEKKNLTKLRFVPDPNGFLPLENAKSAYNIAVKDYLLKAEKVEETKVFAPFSGIIAKRHIEPKQRLAPGTAVVDLIAIDTLYVRFGIPEFDLPYIQLGKKINISLDALPAERNLIARVSRIAETADGKDQSYLVEAELKNSKNIFKPGMTARSRALLYTKKNQIRIPVEAVLNRFDGTKYVFLFIDGAGVEQAVTTGVSQGDQVLILSGLEPGMQVVVRGQQFIKAGDRLIASEDN